MSIAENIREINSTIPGNVTLVAVSKTHPPGLIMEAYNAGQRHFGENKVQELVYKASLLPSDIKWHMIGHLQTNKVKLIARLTHMVHGVDSLKLLEVINKEAIKANHIVDCLLQVHISLESSKFGFSVDELSRFFEEKSYMSLQNVRPRGLMGMATFTDDENQVRQEFKLLKQLFNQVKSHYFQDEAYFDTLSMGMSGDYTIAIEEGSTLIRVGSLVFGERDYPPKV